MRRLTKWLLWIGAIGLLVFLGVVGFSAYMMHRAEPTLRAALIDTLQKRFQARVELDAMHVSVMNGFRVEANGLRIWLPDAVQAQSAKIAAIVDPTGKSDLSRSAQAKRHTEPWIKADSLWFDATSRVRPGQQVVISVFHLEGVHIVLPPKDLRPKLGLNGNQADDGANTQLPKPDPNLVRKETQENSQGRPVTSQGTIARQDVGGNGFFKLPRLELRRIECRDITLLIERRQETGKNKEPLQFEFKRASLTPDGHGGPVYYDVDMVNAKPIGNVHSTGHFGPWVAADPHALPVYGDYRFENADLSTIKGIAGNLSSTGHFQGSLNKILARGTTETPDFRLERVHKGPGVRLATSFQAIVDGTNGDVWLSDVDGMLGRTHMKARGQVLRADDLVEGAKGHDIQLDVAIDRGRIQDVLEISADAQEPFVLGNLQLNSKLHIPAGPQKVFEKMGLDGQFHLSNLMFSNPSMQGKIRQLSLRGLGRPGELKNGNVDAVKSEMKGHFKMSGGTLELPDLDYSVPGAEIMAHGKYGMQQGTLDFQGHALLEASLSKIVGGWKGFLLKPADRYLRKNGAGTDVPIHVEGTRKEPKFGVDFDKMGKTDESLPPGRMSDSRKQ